MSDRMRKGIQPLDRLGSSPSGATIGIAAATLVVSLLLVPLVGMEFMPSMDQGTISISVSMPQYEAR